MVVVQAGSRLLGIKTLRPVRLRKEKCIAALRATVPAAPSRQAIINHVYIRKQPLLLDAVTPSIEVHHLQSTTRYSFNDCDLLHSERQCVELPWRLPGQRVVAIIPLHSNEVVDSKSTKRRSPAPYGVLPINDP
jgi:hypothetical protein